MTKPVFPKYPLVLIEWDDHYSEDKWESVNAATDVEDEVGKIRSVGWLIGENAREYRIVQNIGIDNQCSMRMVILKGTVARFKILRKNG